MNHAPSYGIEEILSTAGQSNTIRLTPDEAIRTKALIEPAERIIEALEIRIAKLNTELREEKDRLERIKIATAPHKAVPLEVIGQVLLHCASGGVAMYPSPLGSASWALRQVCSQWRKAVLREPSVWDMLVVRHDASRKDEPRNFERHIDFWLSKISNPLFPLSLDLRSSVFNDHIHNFIIQPHSHRIRAIAMLPTISFLSMDPRSFPYIESLMFNFNVHLPAYEWRDLIYTFHPSQCFAGMNSLRSLHANLGPRRLDLWLPTSIPWQGLTSLKLTSETMETRLAAAVVLQALKSCSNLTYCEIDIVVNNKPPMETDAHLPNLRNLVIREHIDVDPSTSILDFIVAPVLCFLTTTPFDPVATSSFVRRSNCSLELLTVPVESQETARQGLLQAPGEVNPFFPVFNDPN